MAGLNIISGAKQYTSAVKVMPYANSRYARALSDNTKFKYSLMGGETMVMEITGETAGSYDPATGFHISNTAEGGWTAHTAEYDRELCLSGDAVDEMDNVLAGMPLIITEKAKASWKKLGPEIDALCASKVSANMPEENKHTGVGYELTADKIIDTLNAMDLQFTNLGYDGEVAVMLNTKIAGNLRTALKDHSGLASNVMLSVAPTTGDYDGKTLEYTSKVTKFGDRFYIYEVPAASMGNKVIMLDKKSAGQEVGGFKLDTTAEGYHEVLAQFIALDSAALSIRHLVGNMTVPQRFLNLSDIQLNKELTALNQMYDGVAVIKSIGVDQEGDQIKIMSRIKYGPTFFETQKHLMFEIY